MVDKLFVATKAFIVHQGKVLVLRESSKYEDGVHASRYDVPGGRMEPGQKFDESLWREVAEETGLDIQIGRVFFVNEAWPVVRGEQWQIVRMFFECEADTDEVRLSQDHDSYIWIDPADYQTVNVIDNLYPAFEAYLSNKVVA